MSQGVATVQIKELESPSLLPTLEALDAEFGREERAAGPRKEGGASMNARFTPTQFESPTHVRAARPTGDATKVSSQVRPSLGRRVLRRLARVLIVFCVGVGTALAWQSYGDAARAMIANSSPQLAWLAPQTAPVVSTAPDVVSPVATASPELQQLALGLAAVRQTVDQLTAQLAAGQRQMSDDVAKLRANEQEILHKLSAAPPRPAAAPKPAPMTPAASPSVPAR
jgi:hypothetical protein